MPKIVGDLGQLIVAIGFKKLPKVQKIAKSGHTTPLPPPPESPYRTFFPLRKSRVVINFNFKAALLNVILGALTRAFSKTTDKI